MIGDIAGIATAVAVLLAAAGLFAQAHQRKFGLAQVYIQRYWEVAEYLLTNHQPPDNSPDAVRYLRLCEDEYDVARLGWIELGVWTIWHDGIRGQICDLRLDFNDFEHIKLCMTTKDHHATNCPGVGERGWRRKLAWWIEAHLAG